MNSYETGDVEIAPHVRRSLERLWDHLHHQCDCAFSIAGGRPNVQTSPVLPRRSTLMCDTVEHPPFNDVQPQ